MPQDGVHVLAAGNPQQSQAFRTITGQVIWPGDVLAAACEYDSSNRTEEATDVCDIDLMVHSALPHFGSCTEQNVVVEEGTPGDMTRAAELLPDPFPLWKPPQQDTILNQVSCFGGQARMRQLKRQACLPAKHAHPFL